MILAAVVAAVVLACAVVFVFRRTERFSPLHAPSGVIARRQLCSPDAAAVLRAANGSAHDRLVAAARTQTSAYPSVVPS